MIQDLNDLSVMGKENRELLTPILKDISLLDKAARTAGKMASLLAKSTADRMGYDEVKKIRDQAYTHLKETVDEIREYGRYVFRHNKEHAGRYRSDYLRRKKRKHVPNDGKLSELK